MLLSVLVLLAAVAEMMLPSLLAQMINSGVTDSSQSTIFILAAVMAGVTALACIVNFLSVRIASRISTDFSATLRGQVFEKVQSFSAAELDKFGTASLVTRSTSDITNVQNFPDLRPRGRRHRRSYCCNPGAFSWVRPCYPVCVPLFNKAQTQT